MGYFEDDEYAYQYDDYLMESSDGSCTASVLRQSAFNLVCLFAAAAFCFLVRNARCSKQRAFWYVIISHLLVYQFSSNFWGIFGFLTLATVTGLIMIKTNMRAHYVLVSQIALIMLLQFTLGTEYMLSVRGIMMLHAMRVISMAYEESHQMMDQQSTASMIEFFYFPPVMIMGPFLSPSVFVGFQFGDEDTDYFTKITSAMYWICASLIALLVSGCYLDMITPPNAFVENFIVAVSFRASHYFVCFLSQALVTFLIFEEEVEVTNFAKIEWPRSVSSIVKNWNLPMHGFLHEYIFSAEVFSSACCNAFLTFLVSGLLHGYDPQILITLVTLAFIAFAETRFRKKLANQLSMCVESKKCFHCDHENDGLIAKCINLFFTVLAIYHLIFTGMPFTNEYAGVGYPVEHTLASYQSHEYLSLYISFFFLIASTLM